MSMSPRGCGIVARSVAEGQSGCAAGNLLVREDEPADVNLAPVEMRMHRSVCHGAAALIGPSD